MKVFPADNYLSKENNRNTSARPNCENIFKVNNKGTRTTSMTAMTSTAFNDFMSSDMALMSLLLTFKLGQVFLLFLFVSAVLLFSHLSK